MEKTTTDSFLTFFNNYSSAMLIIDPSNGKILNANASAVKYYGYSLKTFMSMNIHEINTLSKNQVHQEQQNALKENRNHFNFIHSLANGEKKDVEVHSSPIKFKGKTVLLSIIYDIPNRKKELTSLQNDLDSTLSAIPDLLFELGLDGYYYSVRSSRTELMAAPPEEMIGKTVSDILPSNAADICLEALKEASKKGFSEGKQISLTINHTKKWFELSIARKANLYPDGPRFIVLSRDITTRKEAEKEILDSQNRFKALHDATSGGIAIHEKGLILECNASLSNMFGYSYKELIGMNGLLLIAENSRDIAIEKIINAYEKPYEVYGCKKDGKEFPLRVESREIIYKNKSTRVTEFNDIGQEKKMQDQLKHMAYYDSLTNLPNRSLLSDRLQQAINQAKRRNRFLAVVYIDLDGFKKVNDTYGHNIGDKLLIKISKGMKNALREEDTIARFGGDEFVATIVNLEKPKDCIATLKRLLKSTSNIIDIDGISLQVSASLGVTIYPDDNVDTDMLIRHADQAMYQAKQDGKNRYNMFQSNIISS